jgi:hypothetical protein
MTRTRTINVYEGIGGWWTEEVGTNNFVCERHGPLTQENAHAIADEMRQRDPLKDEVTTAGILPFAADGRYLNALPKGQGRGRRKNLCGCGRPLDAAAGGDAHRCAVCLHELP